MKRIDLLLTVALLPGLAHAPMARAQTGGDYALRWNTLGAGAMTTAGGEYALGGTVAQQATGSLAAGDYTLAAGFWAPAANPNVDVAGGGDLPLAFAARLAGPNPFRETASLRFDLPEPRRVSVALYGIDGRLVREIADGPFGAGRHAAYWDGKDHSGRPVPPGIYFARIAAGDAQATLRLVRLH